MFKFLSSIFSSKKKSVDQGYTEGEIQTESKDTNAMVTGFANDLGYQILGMKMVNDPFAGKYEKRPR